MTLKFDLLTPKLEASILVSKCTNAESLVEIGLMSNTFQDIVNNVPDARTDGRMNSQKT